MFLFDSVFQILNYNCLNVVLSYKCFWLILKQYSDIYPDLGSFVTHLGIEYNVSNQIIKQN